MTIHNSLAELIGNTPLVKLNHIPQRPASKPPSPSKKKSRILSNPRRLLQGPHRRAHHRRAEQSGQLKPGGVTSSPPRATPASAWPWSPSSAATARFSPCRTRFPNPSARCCAPTVPKSSSHRPTPARTTRAPTTRSPNDWPTRFPALPPEPVRQPERPAEPLLHHRPRDLGGYGPQGHALRGRHWHRRHHLRHRQVPQGSSNGAVKVIGSDPEGSIYSASSRDEVHQYDIEGAGEDFYPKAFDRNITDDIVRVSDAEAFEMTRRLAGEEALLVGGSSGMAVASAIKYALANDLDENQIVVVLAPDSGRSYLEKIFNDDWMRANGYGDIVERTSKPSLAEQYLNGAPSDEGAGDGLHN